MCCHHFFIEKFCVIQFTVLTTVRLPPAKDAFATATRMIKPECLVHTCADQVFLYLYRCVTLAGLSVREGKMIG